MPGTQVSPLPPGQHSLTSLGGLSCGEQLRQLKSLFELTCSYMHPQLDVGVLKLRDKVKLHHPLLSSPPAVHDAIDVRNQLDHPNARKSPPTEVEVRAAAESLTVAVRELLQHTPPAVQQIVRGTDLVSWLRTQRRNQRIALLHSMLSRTAGTSVIIALWVVWLLAIGFFYPEANLLASFLVGAVCIHWLALPPLAQRHRFFAQAIETISVVGLAGFFVLVALAAHRVLQGQPSMPFWSASFAWLIAVAGVTASPLYPLGTSSHSN